MEEKIELLREKLHVAIDKGNGDDILRASNDLDAEIVKWLITKNTFIEQNREV